ncbi:unnamed protein product [Schistosoma margrebowiei]|uniref:Uncharacterized protein n=1 Tax=Schistosoma margrebowiei TaxID=48269 RepID=A0A183MN02_9TREM|nr:unnamed protein product [Schistosoma margrebowiei]
MLQIWFFLFSFFKGKVPVVCLSAVHSFLNILALISGLSEWKRGIRLISHLVILPDLNSSGEIISSFSKTRESKNSNYLLTQRIMEVGNVLEALTITSNAGFLRSVRKSVHEMSEQSGRPEGQANSSKNEEIQLSSTGNQRNPLDSSWTTKAK